MPVPPMQRQQSAISARTVASSSASTASGGKKTSRARDLLRDYYGLSSGGSNDKTNSGDSDPLNLDLPSFSAPAYLQMLLNTSSLPQLLRTSTTLSASIADLESERQSLVYNHHHELIDASITISKMKVRSESLETTLEQLKAGLARCSELESDLRSETSKMEHNSSQEVATDWENMLSKLVHLPVLMQSVGTEDALKLWGSYEPVLRSWKDAGVKGIEEVEAECRDVLSAHNLSPETMSTRRRSGSTMTIRAA